MKVRFQFSSCVLSKGCGKPGWALEGQRVPWAGDGVGKLKR